MRQSFKAILITSIYIAGLCLIIRLTIASGPIQIIRLTQWLALSALAVLYVTLIITPVFFLKPKNKLFSKLNKSINFFVASTLVLAIAHASLAFWGQLDGFAGLSFLPERYIEAILLGFTGLVTLLLMIIFINTKLGSKLGFIVGVFILLHALSIGTHFTDLSAIIPKIVTTLVFILLVIQGLQIDEYVRRRSTNYPKLGLVVPSIIFLSGLYIGQKWLASSENTYQGIHGEHLKNAREALNKPEASRFTVSFSAPENLKAGSSAELVFTVFNASSGLLVTEYELFQEKLLHLIVVDNQLQNYQHLHPEFKNGKFVVSVLFPKNGTYHLYTDFMPKGAIEQQFGFSLNVGSSSTSKPNLKADTDLAKIKGNYQVEMEKINLKANLLTNGQQTLKFIVKTKDGKEVDTLRPYLEAYGHLVLINQDSFDYIHVHPGEGKMAKAGLDGGPIIEFTPLGLYGPIKPGTYKAFLQINPEGNLTLVEFVLEVK